MATEPRHDAPMEEEEEEELLDVPENEKQADPFYKQPIRRMCDGTEFEGTIEDIEIGKVTREKLYQVRYKDGDLEHLTADQARDCIKAGQVKVTKKAAGGGPVKDAEEAEDAEAEDAEEGEEEEQSDHDEAEDDAVSKKPAMAGAAKAPVKAKAGAAEAKAKGKAGAAKAPVKAAAVRKSIEKPKAPDPKAKAKAKAAAAKAKAPAPKAKAAAGKAKAKAKAKATGRK